MILKMIILHIMFISIVSRPPAGGGSEPAARGRTGAPPRHANDMILEYIILYYIILYHIICYYIILYHI